MHWDLRRLPADKNGYGSDGTFLGTSMWWTATCGENRLKFRADSWFAAKDRVVQHDPTATFVPHGGRPKKGKERGSRHVVYLSARAREEAERRARRTGRTLSEVISEALVPTGKKPAVLWLCLDCHAGPEVWSPRIQVAHDALGPVVHTGLHDPQHTTPCDCCGNIRQGDRWSYQKAEDVRIFGAPKTQ
jgi:hypothetical protein